MWWNNVCGVTLMKLKYEVTYHENWAFKLACNRWIYVYNVCTINLMWCKCVCKYCIYMHACDSFTAVTERLLPIYYGVDVTCSIFTSTFTPSNKQYKSSKTNAKSLILLLMRIYWQMYISQICLNYWASRLNPITIIHVIPFRARPIAAFHFG